MWGCSSKVVLAHSSSSSNGLKFESCYELFAFFPIPIPLEKLALLRGKGAVTKIQGLDLEDGKLAKAQMEIPEQGLKLVKKWPGAHF